MKKYIKTLIKLLFYPLKLISFKKEFIIIQATGPYIYSGNARYLYEYLSKKKIKIFWYTKNADIKNYLKKKKYKYIFKYNIFKLFYVTFKAKIVIDDGSTYFNFLNLLPRETIRICMGHGVGNKKSMFDYIKNLTSNKPFDYVNFTSQIITKKMEQKKVTKIKIIQLGYPKIDILKKKKQKKC